MSVSQQFNPSSSQNWRGNTRNGCDKQFIYPDEENASHVERTESFNCFVALFCFLYCHTSNEHFILIPFTSMLYINMENWLSETKLLAFSMLLMFMYTHFAYESSYADLHRLTIDHNTSTLFIHVFIVYGETSKLKKKKNKFFAFRFIPRLLFGQFTVWYEMLVAWIHSFNRYNNITQITTTTTTKYDIQTYQLQSVRELIYVRLYHEHSQSVN